MLLCRLAHLAQKRAAATRTKGQVPSFLIRMADKGGVVAVMNVGLALTTALVLFKYNRAAMASYGLYEVLLSYRTKEDRRAVCDFVTRQLPTEINTKADALAMLGFPSDSKPSVEEVCKRLDLLLSLCCFRLPKSVGSKKDELLRNLFQAKRLVLHSDLDNIY